jgi:HSP20 family protein
MPTVTRKSHLTITESRREVPAPVSWHTRSSAWKPLTDVYETDDSLVVKMEIAGLRDEDLDVVVQENVLIVSGTRSDSSERRAYHQMEIPFGKFEIAIDLPYAVNVEKAGALYKDGFLMVTLPKASLKQIEEH